MRIADHINVNTYYTRSINLERDKSAKAVLDSYIPTTRALQTLERIAGTLNQENVPRSWALVGPYGSGKSVFAVFLAHLLGQGGSAANKSALKTLRKADSSLAGQYRRHLGADGRYCQVLLSGGPQAFGRSLTQHLAQGAQDFWGKKRGKKPAVIKKLAKAAQQEHCPASDLLALLDELQLAVANAGGKGVLIGIDELGKFLEYEARHYGHNDVFLLQMLAEHAQKDSPAPCSIVVLLHQSFEQYARGLGEALKAEWAKIQGRFETVPFLESSEQVLRVAANAFDPSFDKKARAAITKNVASETQLLAKAGVLPQGLAEDQAVELFSQCYPLHPITALLLPMLCQKVAQNERTLFSYLGSYEPDGFLDSIGRLQSLDDWILPDRLYDYFVQNQPTAVTEPLAARRWAEIVNAVERLGDAPEEEVALVKVIGLLNLIGTQGKFRASKELLKFGRNSRKLNAVLKSLEQQSIIQFRRFSSEYRVWQGSDFDIEAAVDEIKSELGDFSLATVLSERQTIDPIVVRRHSIQTGSLRYLQVQFYDRRSAEVAEADGKPQLSLVKSVEEEEGKKEPVLICYLAEGKEDVAYFTDKSEKDDKSSDVLAVCPLGPQLRQAITEVLALERIQNQYPDLAQDPVALTELRTRLAAAQHIENELVASILDEPQKSTWFWRGKALSAKDRGIFNRRSFQAELSRVMDSVYKKAPIIANELINRDKPSAQANSARNRLLERLLTHIHEPDLGIEKNPPEKAIYDSLIKAPGLHRERRDGFGIGDPKPKDKFNFAPFWAEIEHFFSNSENQARSLEALGLKLTAPPFGLKRGVLPLVYVLAILRYQDDLALYENKIYTPYLTKELVERLTKRPQDFTVQRFKIDGLRQSIFKEYADALFSEADKVNDIISVARPLAKFLVELPEYTQQTKRLSDEALGVRDALRIAKSPQKLLFELIPQACGYNASSKKLGSTGFSGVLMDVLSELKYALPKLREEMQLRFCEVFHLDKTSSLAELRNHFVFSFKRLETYTIDSDGLKAFLQRAANADEKTSDSEWFDNLLDFLGRKHLEKWTDTDRDSAELRLVEFGRRIHDLIKLRSAEQFDVGDAEHEAYLIKSTSRLTGEKDEVVFINEERSKAIQTVLAAVREKLEELTDPDLRLAALAKVADEILVDHREGQQSSSKSEVKEAKKDVRKQR